MPEARIDHLNLSRASSMRQICDGVRLPRWIVRGILGVSAIRAAGEALGYAYGPRRWAE